MRDGALGLADCQSVLDAGRILQETLAVVSGSSKQVRADLAVGVRDAEFSGVRCGDLASGDDVTGTDGTWLHHPGVHSAQPKLPAEA